MLLDWMFIVLTFVSFILLFLSVEYYREKVYFWSFVFSFVSFILFIVLGVAGLEIEIPYTTVIDDAVVSGVHIVTSKTSVALLYFFNLMAVIMFIFMSVQVFNTVMSLFKKNRRNSDMMQ